MANLLHSLDCMKTILLTSLCVLNLGTIATQAQPSAPTPEVQAVPGQPWQVKYADGRVLEAVYHSNPEPLVTSLVLTENSCTQRQSAYCQIRFPRESSRYAFRWVVHPDASRIGQLAMRKRTSTADGVETTTLEPQTMANFDFAFYRKTEPQLNLPATESAFGEIKCDNNEWIPWKEGPGGQRQAKILAWDEDFEQGNDEFLYSQDLDRPSFNAITGHLENIQIAESKGKILFGRPSLVKSLFGGFINYPLLAYKLQLTFRSPSLADPDDLMCQAKLTVNLTEIFTDFTKYFGNAESARSWNSQEFSPLIVNSKAYESSPNHWKGNNPWLFQDLQ